MKTIRHPTPATFLSVAGEFLAANEALNNIFFGIAGDAVLDRYAGADNLWLSAHDEDAVVGAALQTPPYELAIAHGSSPEAVLALARAAQTQRGDALDGVRVPAEYVPLLEAELARGYEREEAIGIYELSRVIAPSPVLGAMRSAVASDLDRVVEFAVGFARDTGAVRSEGDALVARVAALVSEGIFVVWELEGELVSMAASRGPTPRGIRISWVYTPPELRGRGYAGALVAGLSQRELDAGREFCFLFTDLDNPASNKVYRRVGYRQVGEMGVYRAVGRER
ncbi:MAG: GNAT family N-acetyltransferase [Myxococcales bacterium]|nr:GNAT family N-acetyltransferase [Myxococcales bacterium]MCB9751924.1 GNAT family N-acetyltransferase [Myxococcales bacterium]